MGKEHDLRPKVVFYKNVQRIVESLKMIAAVKSKQFSIKSNNAQQFLYHYSNNLSISSLPSNPDGRVLNIIIGANKGLCGNYVSLLGQLLKDKPIEGEIILIGHKFPALIKKLNPDLIIKTFELSYSQELINNIADTISNLTLSQCNVYSWNVKEKKPILQQWLEKIDLDEIHLTYSENNLSYNDTKLIHKHILISKINAILTNAIQMEETCRLYAMDQAVKNGKKIIADLNQKINQARQQNITTELNEIISGCEYAN